MDMNLISAVFVAVMVSLKAHVIVMEMAQMLATTAKVFA
jgi:hypothetical protein